MAVPQMESYISADGTLMYWNRKEKRYMPDNRTAEEVERDRLEAQREEERILREAKNKAASPGRAAGTAKQSEVDWETWFDGLLNDDKILPELPAAKPAGSAAVRRTSTGKTGTASGKGSRSTQSNRAQSIRAARLAAAEIRRKKRKRARTTAVMLAITACLVIGAAVCAAAYDRSHVSRQEMQIKEFMERQQGDAEQQQSDE